MKLSDAMITDRYNALIERENLERNNQEYKENVSEICKISTKIRNLLSESAELNELVSDLTNAHIASEAMATREFYGCGFIDGVRFVVEIMSKGTK